MRITNAEFNVLVGDVVTTLNKFKVSKREQCEWLPVSCPMRQDIVGRRDPPLGKGGVNDEK
ncbi:MAG: hypothetical protein ACREIJ_09395, partial [Nitrospiraceae bacterium]